MTKKAIVVIVAIVASDFFLLAAMAVGGFFLGSHVESKHVPSVDVSWGTGDNDEDDLVVLVDGVERYRVHGDKLDTDDSCHAPKEDSDITDCDFRNGAWYKR